MSSSTDDLGSRIVVGQIGKPHGLLGEVTFLLETDNPSRFVVGSEFLTDSGRDLVVSGVSPYRDKGLVILFEGVKTRQEAETLRGLLLTVAPNDRRQLADDEFWPEQLAGLEAVAPDGSALGIVDRIEFGPGQDRLVVTTLAGLEVQVPFVSAFVGDPVDGRLVIDAPEGLF